MQTFSVNTNRRTEMIAITSDVAAAVLALGRSDGMVTVFVPHTTAGVTINENADPDVAADMAMALERLIPWDAGYAHAEGNSAAHVRASLMGASINLPLVDGRLRMGTWQGIYFCEFDGPRTRNVWVY